MAYTPVKMSKAVPEIYTSWKICGNPKCLKGFRAVLRYEVGRHRIRCGRAVYRLYCSTACRKKAENMRRVARTKAIQEDMFYEYREDRKAEGKWLNEAEKPHSQNPS
jgi:hypothetical protein